jgi:hypothetical protein
MILRYTRLAAGPEIFAAMTGIAVATFDEIVAELAPRLTTARAASRDSPGRLRAPGAGHPFELAPRDALLATVVWLRHYPTCDVQGYLLGASKATASWTIREAMLLREAAGRDAMRPPDPGRYRRRSLSTLLQRIPKLAAALAPTSRRRGPTACSSTASSRRCSGLRGGPRPSAGYSSRKRMHTIKAQVAVCEATGRVVDVCGDAVGPFADLTLLATSELARRLEPELELIGDGAYMGMAEFRTGGRGLGRRRDQRRRVGVEHGIGRLRAYQSLADRDRHHRQGHERRVIAVARLVNRVSESWLAA